MKKIPSLPTIAIGLTLATTPQGCNVPVEQATGLTQASRDNALKWIERAQISCELQRAYIKGKDQLPLIPEFIIDEIDNPSTSLKRRDEIILNYGSLIEKERERMRPIRQGEKLIAQNHIETIAKAAAFQLEQAGCDPVVRFWCDVESKYPNNEFSISVKRHRGTDCLEEPASRH